MLAQHFLHLTREGHPERAVAAAKVAAVAREDHPERYVQTYTFMYSLTSIFFVQNHD